MAAMVLSNGQLASSGACVPTANGRVRLTSEAVTELVNEVLKVASPEACRAVHQFYLHGTELPMAVRIELGGLLSGYAPRFAN